MYDRRKDKRRAQEIVKKLLAVDKLDKIANELDAALRRCASEGILVNHTLTELYRQTRLAKIGLRFAQDPTISAQGKSSKRGPGRTPNAFDRLIEDLAGVYKDSFGTRPTLSRDFSNRTPNSPFVRFADQTLKEFGVKNKGKYYSRDSIMKSLSDIRTGRLPTGRLAKGMRLGKPKSI
jgi:hypothetical protein